MAQAVSRQRITSEARFRSQGSLREMCGGQSDTDTGFSPEYFGFTLSLSFHQRSIHTSFTCCCYQKNKEAKPGNLLKAILFRKSRIFG